MQVEKLRSLIRESINEYIKEIDIAAEGAAMEARIDKCEEAIQMRETKLDTIAESDHKDLIDDSKIKNIENEIKVLKKAKAKFEKQREKMQNKKDKKENPKKEMTTDAPVEEADVTAEMGMDMSDKPKEEVLNESFLKMQKLAGVITEAQYNSKKSLIEGEDDGFDLKAAYKTSPATQSYEDILDIVKGYESPGFNAAELFKKSFSPGKPVTKDAWEKWSSTIDGGYDPEGYVYLNWISLTDPDIYRKAGIA